MKVLVACEESQTVCKAFRKRGHEAYSCDIMDCSGGHPEWHIKCDVLPLLHPKWYDLNRDGEGNQWEGYKFKTVDGKTHQFEGKWDLIIAHPPCQFLTNTGNPYLNVEKWGEKAIQRAKDREKAFEFFMQFANADCNKICIENPTPSRVYELPKYTQVIQPWMFGHPVQKRTCLWLKGLEPLKPTEIVEERQSSKVPGNWFNKGGKERQQNRAKTFPGIARAMAEQWG